MPITMNVVVFRNDCFVSRDLIGRSIQRHVAVSGLGNLIGRQMIVGDGWQLKAYVLLTTEPHEMSSSWLRSNDDVGLNHGCLQ